MTPSTRNPLASLVFAAALLAAAPPAGAVLCTIDDVPAATLLLPYFEVDLDGWEVMTLFSVNNASATAVLAHVVVWSDLSVPVLDFSIYLTGYDVVTVNLRDILIEGRLPQTASAGQDPDDSISPQGIFSQDVDFASCQGFFPLPDLPSDYVDHLQDSLTGKFSSILGGCVGLDHGDRIARGYVTVDTVSACSLEFPASPGYFVSGGAGVATNQNVLWGDYFISHELAGLAYGETLVHVEASGTHPETSTPGEYTFYGRYVGWTAADNREPLSTRFATRYLDGGIFDGGTDLLVWRDSKVVQGSFQCGTAPPWYPLGQEQIVIFDEEENPEVPQTLPVSPQPPGAALAPFPAEAQRTRVGGPELPVSPDFGWLLLNLNTEVTAAGAVPPEDSAAAQAWVVVAMSTEGLFSAGFEAIQLDSACEADHRPVGGGG